MHKKYHEKIKILDILAVTTQAREGIETLPDENLGRSGRVTTQAHEGIETSMSCNKQHLESRNNSSPRGH